MNIFKTLRHSGGSRILAALAWAGLLCGCLTDEDNAHLQWNDYLGEQPGDGPISMAFDPAGNLHALLPIAQIYGYTGKDPYMEGAETIRNTYIRHFSFSPSAITTHDFNNLGGWRNAGGLYGTDVSDDMLAAKILDGGRFNFFSFENGIWKKTASLDLSNEDGYTNAWQTRPVMWKGAPGLISSNFSWSGTRLRLLLDTAVVMLLDDDSFAMSDFSYLQRRDTLFILATGMAYNDRFNHDAEQSSRLILMTEDGVRQAGNVHFSQPLTGAGVVNRSNGIIAAFITGNELRLAAISGDTLAIVDTYPLNYSSSDDNTRLDRDNCMVWTSPLPVLPLPDSLPDTARTEGIPNSDDLPYLEPPGIYLNRECAGVLKPVSKVLELENNRRVIISGFAQDTAGRYHFIAAVSNDVTSPGGRTDSDIYYITESETGSWDSRMIGSLSSLSAD